MNRKVLVIGANSFIASKLIGDLKKNAQVIGIYNTNKDNLHHDINNLPVTSVKNLDIDFDEVYLLSAVIPNKLLGESERKKMFEVNVQLVDFVCKKFTQSRIIYSSSVSVYKPKEKEIFENDNEGGINEYGVSKIWGERIIQGINNFSIVRFSSVYGVGMKLNTIIPNYINQALESNVIKIWGNGLRRQNYIHVNDVVNFLLKAGEAKENEVFLATTSQSISNLQVAEMISQKTGCDISFVNDDLSPSFYYNNSYTENKLQYKASVSIDHGLTELIEWITKKY